MKIDKSAIAFNCAFFGLGFIFTAAMGFVGAIIGLILLSIAFANLIMIAVFSANGNRNGMLTSLIFAGVLFTIGFSVCSNSIFN